MLYNIYICINIQFGSQSGCIHGRKALAPTSPVFDQNLAQCCSSHFALSLGPGPWNEGWSIRIGSRRICHCANLTKQSVWRISTPTLHGSSTRLNMTQPPTSIKQKPQMRCESKCLRMSQDVSADLALRRVVAPLQARRNLRGRTKI